MSSLSLCGLLTKASWNMLRRRTHTLECGGGKVFEESNTDSSPRWCLRLVVAVGLACSDLQSYAGGSVATGRVSQAGQVKSEVPD
jgi:hypothetical protein